MEPLYRLTFRYSQEWNAAPPDDSPPAGGFFFIAEGRCTGAVVGRFLVANHLLQPAGGKFLPDLQGMIETEDGATIVLDLRWQGRADPPGPRQQVVVAVTHTSDDPRYTDLNDSLSVGCGEVRRLSAAITELVIDVSELIWEPIDISGSGAPDDRAASAGVRPFQEQRRQL